jgi:hypothetical protein
MKNGVVMTKLERNLIGDQIRAESHRPTALFEAELENAISSRLSSTSVDSGKALPRRPKSDKGV